MPDQIAQDLRDVGDTLSELGKYSKSRIAYTAARHIESLEQKIADLEGMLEDSEHFRDYWFDRVHPQKAG